MPGPDSLFPSAFGAVLYGPMPGVEFLTQFFQLLAFVGLAVAAVLTAPIYALLRRLRRGRGAPPAAPPEEPTTAPVPEPSDEGSRDRV